MPTLLVNDPCRTRDNPCGVPLVGLVIGSTRPALAVLLFYEAVCVQARNDIVPCTVLLMTRVGAVRVTPFHRCDAVVVQKLHEFLITEIGVPLTNVAARKTKHPVFQREDAVALGHPVAILALGMANDLATLELDLPAVTTEVQPIGADLLAVTVLDCGGDVDDVINNVELSGGHGGFLSLWHSTLGSRMLIHFAPIAEHAHPPMSGPEKSPHSNYSRPRS